MEIFRMKYILAYVCFLLLRWDIVMSEKQCDCESLSFLTELVQQEIFQRKLDYTKLRSELRRLSEGRNVVTRTSAGTTPTIGVSGSEKDNPTKAFEQRLDDLEKQLEVKLQQSFDDLEERTKEHFRSKTERNSFYKLTITKALEKEKNERLNFNTRIQSLIEDLKGAFVEFKTNAEDLIDNKMEAHVEINQKFQKKISENFEDFKNTISSSFEEHVMKTSLELASQKNDSELFEIQVSNELDQFEADISGIVKAAGDQTSSSVAKLLDTITNSTENVNECIADIGAIKGDINDITSDTEREKKAASELRKLFDESTAKVNKIFNFVAKIMDRCQDGTEFVGGKCYFFSNYHANWHDASAACKRMGRRLIEIRNAMENEYIKSRVIKSGQVIWMGFHDFQKEGIWQWDSDPQLTEVEHFTNWNKGEPNDDKDDEDCGMMLTGPAGLWNDGHCGTLLHFMCESPFF